MVMVDCRFCDPPPHHSPAVRAAQPHIEIGMNTVLMVAQACLIGLILGCSLSAAMALGHWVHALG